MTSGERIFTAVLVSGIFRIGVIEDVTTFPGGEIGDCDWIGTNGANHLPIVITFFSITLKL